MLCGCGTKCSSNLRKCTVKCSGVYRKYVKLLLYCYDDEYIILCCRVYVIYYFPCIFKYFILKYTENCSSCSALREQSRAAVYYYGRVPFSAIDKRNKYAVNLNRCSAMMMSIISPFGHKAVGDHLGRRNVKDVSLCMWVVWQFTWETPMGKVWLRPPFLNTIPTRKGPLVCWTMFVQESLQNLRGNVVLPNDQTLNP
jgi:hypothetical protein